MAQIICRDLSFAYDGETVLSDINFSLDAGAYLCIVGENGSGKSTLMRGLLGLKTPSTGTITFNDLKPTEIERSSAADTDPARFSGVRARGGALGQVNSMHRRLFYNAADNAAAAENMERPRHR
ncbi:MAG: ATP-binding cassette domain-containing protein [Oscillospiraceae bacterium]